MTSMQYSGHPWVAYPRVTLQLEAIADNESVLASRAWVAKITGECSQYTFRREFLQGQKDYSDANSVGSRGAYLYYHLKEGLYEVSSPKSWKKTNRYFFLVQKGQGKQITKEEALEWLKNS